MAGALAVGAVVAGLSTHPIFREIAARYLGQGAFGKIWKLAALALALVNLKNIPGFWHLRVLRGIIYQIYFQPTVQLPKHLFAPMITSSYNTLYDCDYNIHKSNSTYFADLDVARAHYVGCLVRTGLARLNRGDEEGLSTDTKKTPGKYFVALGAVSCFFQRQIEPLQSFEVYTRILTWDRKWIYIISHIVRKGAIKPDSYVLQPWKKSKKSKKSNAGKDEPEEDLTKHIFATSVARYVFKKGRLTINPEIVLERSRLTPRRPEGVGFPPRAEAASNGATPVVVGTPAENGTLSSPENVATEVSSKLDSVADMTNRAENADDWTWDDMEKERLRGLVLASHFDKLNDSHNELRAGEVLGQYGDYF
ncbi:4HBT like protein [Acrodontium crateriforme]|uniref:4HBT like protein n=1 Tax=Acrodontium crateriforme TaxID=150365 RepID=A0AAQ3RAF5_9PEZI|nr:4HBT like protein [Acrodontium crateriforme]